MFFLDNSQLFLKWGNFSCVNTGRFAKPTCYAGRVRVKKISPFKMWASWVGLSACPIINTCMLILIVLTG